ncbi:MAG TPA: hypothetical protein VIF10_08620 [Methylobacter sp.]|jgi:hypothetical protein
MNKVSRSSTETDNFEQTAVKLSQGPLGWKMASKFSNFIPKER